MFCSQFGGRISFLSAVIVLFAAQNGANCLAQPAQPNSASVEELTAMLQSIDPYRPRSETAGKIAVFGSTSMDAMAHSWASGYKQFHPNVQVEISGAGSEATFEQLQENPSGVGMLSRPVRPEELEALKKIGLQQPTAFVVAREALGVFVHPSNPIKTISGDQLRLVFAESDDKQAPTWGMLGAMDQWSSKPIHVISRSAESGTQKFLEDFVFHSTAMREGVSSHASNAQVLAAVSEDPLAIAICGLRSSQKTVKPLQLMAGASVVPSDDHAILIGQYPLTRPLTMVLDIARTDANAIAAQEFVRYALCQAGQSQAILVGFFPVDLPLLRAGMQRLDASQVR